MSFFRLLAFVKAKLLAGRLSRDAAIEIHSFPCHSLPLPPSSRFN